MSMRFAAFTALVLASVSAPALATETEFCVTLTSHDAGSDTVNRSARCQVRQSLNRGDASARWRCKFNGDERVHSALAEATTVERDHFSRDLVAEYALDDSTPVGSFLLGYLGIADLDESDTLRIRFERNAPVAERAKLSFNSLHNGAREVRVRDLRYFGACF